MAGRIAQERSAMPYNRWEILHLADLHFASPGTNFLDDNKIELPSKLRANIITSFHAELESYARKGPIPFDAAILSGDITTYGQPVGFTTFQKTTAPLVKRLLGGDGRMFIVPGNHDVRWMVDTDKDDHFDVKFADFLKMVESVGAVTSLIPRGKVTSLSPAGTAESQTETLDFLAAGSPLVVDPGRRLVVLCINSSVTCGEYAVGMRDELRAPVVEAMKQIELIKGNGDKPLGGASGAAIHALRYQLEESLKKIEKRSLFDPSQVTHSQLERLRALIELERSRPDGAAVWDESLRVAVLHHPLMPFPGQVTELKMFESMLDASRVLDFLAEHRFHLVLSGHKHQEYVQPRRTLDGPEFLIVGGPTVAGGCPQDSPRGYQVIEAVRNGGKLQVQVGLRLVGMKNGAAQPTPKTYSIIDGTIRNPHFGYCVEWATRPVVTKLDVNVKDDQSDEFMIFVQVESCARARADIESYFQKLGHTPKNKKRINFWGVYDVYGEYDLIIRGEAVGWSDLAIKEIEGRLKEHRPKGKKGGILSSNLRGFWALNGSPLRNAISAEQDDYRKNRWYKVFIVILTPSNVEQEDINEVSKLLRGGLGAAGGQGVDDWVLFWSKRELIVEGLIKCGQYYRLCDVTREIERFADEKGRDKLTHIAYHHDEWVDHQGGNGKGLRIQAPPVTGTRPSRAVTGG
jgi:3',5'-cyclic AMP phosphodiesterase CpdA